MEASINKETEDSISRRMEVVLIREPYNLMQLKTNRLIKL